MSSRDGLCSANLQLYSDFSYLVRGKIEQISGGATDELNDPYSSRGHPNPLDRNPVLAPNGHESVSFQLIQVKSIA